VDESGGTGTVIMMVLGGPGSYRDRTDAQRGQERIVLRVETRAGDIDGHRAIIWVIL